MQNINRICIVNNNIDVNAELIKFFKNELKLVNVEANRAATSEINSIEKYPILVIKNSLYDFQFTFKNVDLRIEIKAGDLIDEIAEVIVNASNNILSLTGQFVYFS